MSLLDVRELQTHFITDNAVIKAVDGVSFNIDKAKSLGIIGESGCGKTVTALSIMGLVARPGKIIGGEVLFNGQDLVQKSPDEMQSIRGKEISMIFQDSLNALNPVITIGEQIAEAVRLHQGLNRQNTVIKVSEMLESVRIPSSKAAQYPHQLSGGMCQRAMIAMAFSCNPSLLIADEPTTALDVIIQAQILDLLQELTAQRQTSLLVVSHDFGVIADLCDSVLVMYMGNIIEQAPVREIHDRPRHPYTQTLLKSILKINGHKQPEVLKGANAGTASSNTGCPYHPRCSHVKEFCLAHKPLPVEIETGHHISCNMFRDN